MEKEPQEECRRCGTCCEKGGPTLHRDDLPLIESGGIPLRDLYTVRKGELAVDPKEGQPLPVSEELIKIRGGDGTWCCRYLDKPSMACRIYDHRPQECRAQKCWDSTEIAALYPVDRLCREKFLAGVSELWQLVEEHERRCSYLRLREIAERLASGDPGGAAAEIAEMVSYDRHLRELVCKRGKMDPEILDFLFGRPMTETVHGFGLTVEKDGDRIVLRPA